MIFKVVLWYTAVKELSHQIITKDLHEVKEADACLCVMMNVPCRSLGGMLNI